MTPRPGLLRTFALAVLVVFTATTSAIRADLTPLHWYRMGEDDASAPASGRPVATLHDSIGTADLTTVLAPTYGLPSFSSAANALSSTLALQSRGGGGYYATGSLLTPATTGFGVELWCRFSSLATGTQCLVYNGTPGVNGWGLYVKDGRYQVRTGATTSNLTVSASSTWQHVALVQKAGFFTLYIDGSSRATVALTSALLAPTGQFTLGATVTSSGATELFSGFIDEVRAFSITDSATPFNPSTDLLINAPRLVTTIGSLSGEQPFGGTADLGRSNVGTPLDRYLYLSNSPYSSSSSGLSIQSVTLAGGDAAEFSLLDQSKPFFPLRPGNQAYYRLRFSPTSPGRKSTTLTVVTNDPVHPVYTLTLTCTAVTEPSILAFLGPDSTGPSFSSNDTPQVFSRTDPGSTTGEEHSFTFYNYGLSNLEITGVSFVGTHPGDFIVTRPPAPSTAPGEMTTFTVKFTPHAPGARLATLAITSNDFYDPTFRILLTGTATSPEIQLTGGNGNTPLFSRAVASWGNLSYDTKTRPADPGEVTAVTAGHLFTAALRSDGSVVAWGFNSSGQLDLPPLTGITAIAAGRSHLLALKSDGTVMAWGAATYGQTTVPAGLTGVTAIAASYDHSVALKGDGTVVAWGKSQLTAVPADLTGVTAIAAGRYHTIALKSDGTVVTWGAPFYGSIAPPADLTGVVGIAAEDGGGSLALKADGSIVRWGFFYSTSSLSSFTFTTGSGPTAITSLYGGDGQIAAIQQDGTLLISTSNNSYNQATPPAGLSGVTAVAVGTDHFAALYDSTIDYGSIDLSQPASQSFTVTNSGTAPLHLASATLSGPDAASFTLNTAGLSTTVAPGESTTLTVVFAPATEGSRRAQLRILSDAAGHPNFTVNLTGAAFTVGSTLDAWRLQHFATTANAGSAADNADPNGNGIPNLLEYVLGGDPTGSSLSPAAVLPQPALDPATGRLQFRFTSPTPLTGGITLTLQGSADLTAAPVWTDLATSTDGAPYAPLVSGLQIQETPAGTGKRQFLLTAPATTRFLRLQATRP